MNQLVVPAAIVHADRTPKSFGREPLAIKYAYP